MLGWFGVADPRADRVVRLRQTSAGQPAGCEAAIHAMRTVFDSPDAEAVLRDVARKFLMVGQDLELIYTHVRNTLTFVRHH